MATLPTFTEFFRSINGRDPFPWQTRLADRVFSEERWPAKISVPTGLGKTACLDIAVWWLSSQAYRAPRLRSAPTRIWWVVSQHRLVDSTAEHARKIARALRDPLSAGLERGQVHVVERVAARLGSLCAEPSAPPLDVVSLGGGLVSRTPADPAQPTVILCTLPMYGSRLLFRGYGSIRRSVDAAMAGTDSLVLLDEVHVAGQLNALITALADCHPEARNVLAPQRLRPMVVSLTATGDAAQNERFELDDEDEAHPVVRQRLDARKPLHVDVVEGESAKQITEATVALISQVPTPAACLVFGNTPRTARATFERLREELPGAEVVLLTGLTREREAARLRTRILDPKHGMATARPADAPRRHHLIVVATQTLEVGADIDAEYLVTEGCGVRALTQRLGRLNRLGRFPNARAVYVHVPPTKARSGRKSGTGADTWPVYGPEPATVLERLLKSGAGSDGGTVDLPPRSIASVLGPPLDGPYRAPEVLPGLLWEWTKTTIPVEGEAPVEPYFSGIAAPLSSVALVWRAYVPDAGGRLWPRGTEHETIDVPLTEARRVLRDDRIRRLASDGVTVEDLSVGDIRPGDRVIVASDAGHMDQYGWNPAASDPVPDASLPELGLPLDAVAIRRICGAELGRIVDTALRIADEDCDVEESERFDAIGGILASIKSMPAPAGWEEAEWIGFLGRLRPCVVEPRDEVPRLPVERPADEVPSDEFDELSLGPVAVELGRHGHAVGRQARAVSERIGLPGDLLRVVERAASLHDIGKADPRFQRWLFPQREPRALFAKSSATRNRWEAMRVSSGWPKGGRHEELSARLVRARLAKTPDWGSPLERDLLVHLVISHHGKGRPLVPPASDETTAVVAAVVEGTPVTADANLAAVDWEQPGRFRRLEAKLGPWGLALLEAIVMRADHAVSNGVDGTPEDT